MENILAELELELKQAKNLADIKIVEKKYLGKTGIIKQKLEQLKQLTSEQKKIAGPEIQQILVKAQQIIENKLQSLEEESANEILKNDKEQINPGSPKVGHLHPITVAINSMNKLFERLGYSIYDSGEIETDEFNFERLNVPKDHAARDMQDTIYIDAPNILLRTQTSSIEARALQNLKPPFRVVCPGRVFRNEKPNKSNHFIFHQYQGVVVQEQVSLKDVFSTLTLLFKELYGPDVIIRFRNKYYPEVEPGIGPDMQCFSCHGKGCGVCKGVGWIEMAGAGIIHKKVLEMAGIDSKKWMGFAFGLGLDRWVMAKYNITDIRTLLEGNLAYKYFEHESVI